MRKMYVYFFVIFISQIFLAQTGKDVEKYFKMIGSDIKYTGKHLGNRRPFINKQEFGITTKAYLINVNYGVGFVESDKDNSLIGKVDVFKRSDKDNSSSNSWVDVVSYYDKKQNYISTKFGLTIDGDFETGKTFDSLEELLTELRGTYSQNLQDLTYSAVYEDDNFIYSFIVIKNKFIYTIKEK